jgi:hypothetical protein
MKFSSLPLGQVKAESWLKNQLLLQAEQVTKQFEKLSPDCKSEGDNRSGWLGGTGENWERGTYYTRGLIASAYVLDDPDMKAQAQKWIDWTLQSQVESGAFGSQRHGRCFGRYSHQPPGNGVLRCVGAFIAANFKENQ